MSQCVQRHAAILTEMDFQALTKGKKKKKLQKGFLHAANLTA